MKKWALILGVSSGFGRAAALELARSGYAICGIHFDLRKTQDRADNLKTELQSLGVDHLFINKNAADEKTIKFVLDQLETELSTNDNKLSLLLHSLAFGSLRPLIRNEKSDQIIDKKAMTMTADVMAHSLVYWIQALVEKNWLDKGSQIIALTSEGSQKAWPNYGAISAAKAALEAHSRQLAVELGGKGIAVNTISAGVCDTPALEKIPNAKTWLDEAKSKMPSKKNTTPEDVAKIIRMMTDEESSWMTGNTIFVDGGERLLR